MDYVLNIVLVEPQIPQNTGNVARTCAVTGARLHLVGPLGFKIDDAKLKRAGLDYWHLLDISYYENLDEFLRKADGTCFYFETKSPRPHSDVIYPENVYIVFGREDKGLPDNLLRENLSTCVRIPMKDNVRSLNLSNCVAVGVYEVLRQWNYPGLQGAGIIPDVEGEKHKNEQNVRQNTNNYGQRL
jgi:tRNA (cytidine/uridine-2'-O-)-methyltransferase